VVAKKQATFDAVRAKFQALQTDLAEKLAYIEKVNSELAKLDTLESAAENQDILAQLKNLVLLNETLKQQETQFKKHCTSQRDELLEMLKNLENDDASGDDEVKRMKEIEALYASDLAKLNKLRQVLADKNQSIAKIQRDIDEIPTRVTRHPVLSASHPFTVTHLNNMLE
jgi:chromosome segregation ATPase